jgi:peptidoglycan/LPS O-acetylase OafA/YrhL
MDVVDAFRGVAVLSVMAFHFTVAQTRPLFPVDAYHYAGRFPGWLEVGRYGVHVFFVISGLVIALTLVRSKTALEFAGRRFARIYPAFLFAVTLALIMTAVLGPPFGPRGAGDYLANLTLAAPHLKRPWLDESYWTLLVEAKFYLVCGLAYAVLRRDFWIGLIGYSLAAAAVAQRWPWGAHNWLFSDSTPYFLAGVSAWLFCFERRRGAAGLCLAAGLALEGYYNLGLPRRCAFEGVCLHLAPDAVAWTYLAATIGGLLVLLATGVRRGIGPLTWIGRISYSLYLVHAQIGLWVIRTLRADRVPDLVAMAAAVVVAFAAASLMYVLVEEPGHRFLLRLPQRLARAPEAATA